MGTKLTDQTTILTIGFTKKNAERFFASLQDAHATKVIDVRLNNISQLAGFTKRDDLQYFLKVHGIGYEHVPELAPTHELLDAYKKNSMSWEDYEKGFLDLIRSRHIETIFSPARFHNAALLCSEDKPHHCHRRIVAEYLSDIIPGIKVVHL